MQKCKILTSFMVDSWEAMSTSTSEKSMSTSTSEKSFIPY